MTTEAILKVVVNDEGRVEITTTYDPPLSELASSTADTLPVSHIIVNGLFEDLSRMNVANNEVKPT